MQMMKCMDVKIIIINCSQLMVIIGDRINWTLDMLQKGLISMKNSCGMQLKSLTTTPPRYVDSRVEMIKKWCCNRLAL